MATTNATNQLVESSPVPVPVSVSADELTAKVVHKRYEGLVIVRTKAINGKGAWYWTHFEPILVHNSDTGLPKAVKLRCSLCEAVFSSSNPSRTASEHLKRGTCPNFNSVAVPISSFPSSSVVNVVSSSSQQQHHNHRKRSSSSSGGGGDGTTSSASYQVPPLAIDPLRFAVELAYPPVVSMATSTSVVSTSGGASQHLMLSGGREDLCALAMLEDSVKKLKSPKSSPGPILSKTQIDSSLDSLADWVYESCGSVSFSSLEHPKFKAFLNQVGLPEISRKEFAGRRLDAKFEEAKAESEARIHDAMFFQISSDGWKLKNNGQIGEENLVNLAVNLPNGTSVFRRTVFTSGYVSSKYAEEVLWDTIIDICGNNLQQCVGIVADKFKAKALRNLENQHPWMVNLSCQFQGFNTLIKDLNKELPIFKNVTEYCLKLANFINKNSQIRHRFAQVSSVRAYPVMMEDILSSTRKLKLVLHDELFKLVSMEDRQIEEMIRNQHFWNELEAVHSLVKLIKKMALEIETDRPRVGQCLPLWKELRVKVKEWCSEFHITESHIEKVIEKRFKKNYHPAWAAAFILDPLYLIKETCGKYLPPFKWLTPEQEKDVDKLITRLVAREEAHIVLMELMKWRTEGLDPVYAQAVQLKQRDPITGKMRIANPQSSRLVWETYLKEYRTLGKVAVRLIFLNATSCGFKSNWSFLRWGMERAQKLIFIAAHSKLERRGFFNDEDEDAEVFALANESMDDAPHDWEKGF